MGKKPRWFMEEKFSIFSVFFSVHLEFGLYI